MMNLKLLSALFLLPLFVLSGCSKTDPLSAVKDGVLDIDKGTTVGKAFDGYKYLKNKSWDAVKTNNGKMIVEVSGLIDFDQVTDKVFGESMAKTQVLLTDQPDEEKLIEAAKTVKKNIRKRFKGFELVVQFQVNEDDSFEIYTIVTRGVKLDGQKTTDMPLPEDMQIDTVKEIYQELLPTAITALILISNPWEEQEK